MSSVSKVCERCGGEFGRGQRVSDSQWKGRRFCSRRCAATKIKITPDEVARLYERGLSSSEISVAAGVSPSAVRRALRVCGVKLRGLSDAMKLSHNKPGMSEKFSRLATGRTHSEETKKKLREVVGAEHPLWRSGMTVTSGGYLQFTSSAANGAHAGRLLHQVICEWKEGRPLGDGFHVHHIDGNKMNNHPDNLMSMPAADHARLHMRERISKHA